MPHALVACLPFLRGVDPKHADPSTAELHGIAIGDREAMPGSNNIAIGLGKGGHNRSPDCD
jgi:hypothetical protein